MRSIGLLAAGAILALASLWPPAVAPGAAQAAPPRDDSGLKNGNFESDFDDWQTWSVVQGSGCDYQAPTFEMNRLSGVDQLHVMDGHNSVKIFIDGQKSYWAGLRQTISNSKIKPGAQLLFKAQGQMDANPGDDKTPSNLAGDANMRVGIDLTGGSSPTSGDIAWSAPENRFDGFYEISVEAVALANSITVFLSSNPTACNVNNNSYWDSAELEIQGYGAVPTSTSPPPTTAVPATAAPTSTPTPTRPQRLLTPTPGSDGSIVYTVQPGDNLSSIALAAGTTVEQLQTLNQLKDTNIIIGQKLILAAAPETPTTAAIPPSETPLPPTPAATPTAEAKTTAPVVNAATGKICLAMYADANADGARGADESLLAGGVFRLTESGGGAIVGEYRTNGIDEPHCFVDLPPATYLVEASGPADHSLTTTGKVGVLLPPQGAADLVFGAQAVSRFRFSTVIAAATGTGLLLAAGAAGFFFYRRRRTT